MNPSRSVSVVGSGAWGSALSHLLRSNGHTVHMWNRTPKSGTTSSLTQVIGPEAEIILAVSVQNIFAVCQAIKDENIEPRICWIASKGLDCRTGSILSTGVESYFPDCTVGIFSGPNIAQEIENGLCCGMTLACKDALILSEGRDLFSETWLKIETTFDIIGVQWWGALKNIMAIGYGLLQQSEMGHNMSATFLTLCAQEIAAIVQAKGGESATTLSFAGIGDLILTSYCPVGRNRAYGQLFPQKPTRLVEGLDTLRIFQNYTLSSDVWFVPTPIIRNISKVLDGSLCISEFPKMIMAGIS